MPAPVAMGFAAFIHTDIATPADFTILEDAGTRWSSFASKNHMVTCCVDVYMDIVCLLINYIVT